MNKKEIIGEASYKKRTIELFWSSMSSLKTYIEIYFEREEL